ncbi:MAG: membrane-binding protein [Bacteroidota bacterium]
MRASFLLICVLILSCQQTPPHPKDPMQASTHVSLLTYSIPAVDIPLDSLSLHKWEGVWKVNGQPYSGYALQLYPNGLLRTKTGFFNGKKQGPSRAYFPDGKLQHITPYHENLVHGEVKNWSGVEGHPLLAIRNFHLGKAHGQHKKWYKNGQIFKIMNYHMGKEEGMQQAYNENGSLYANYEAKNGRSFGLKRSMLCYELDDEKLSLNEQ